MENKEQKIKQIIKFERNLYNNDLLYSNSSFDSRIKMEPPYRILKWLIYSRKTDLYRYRMKSYRGIKKIISKLLYVYYIRKKHLLGERMCIEMRTENIGKGLVIYHYNIVINGKAIIGENLHLHGNNVIGNNGKDNINPIIGNNVTLGAGAMILGGVTIADNIKIGAGAVVVNSFTEPGITIGGIPAHKLK